MSPEEIKEIKQRLEEIEARAAKATPGPWEWTEREWCGPPWAHVVAQDGAVFGLIADVYDRDFILHAPEDVPWLCQVIRQLIGRLEKLEAVAEAARPFADEWNWDGGEWDGPAGAFEHLEKALAALEETNILAQGKDGTI